MPALIHIGTRTFTLPADADVQAVAAAIRTAVEAKGALEFQADTNGSPLTVFVNTAEVDVIVFDWQGTGAGFMHG